MLYGGLASVGRLRAPLGFLKVGRPPSWGQQSCQQGGPDADDGWAGLCPCLQASQTGLLLPPEMSTRCTLLGWGWVKAPAQGVQLCMYIRCGARCVTWMSHSECSGSHRGLQFNTLCSLDRCRDEGRQYSDR